MNTVLPKFIINFMEAFAFFLLFEAFFKRREGFPGWLYIVATLIMGILLDLSFRLFYATELNTLIMFSAIVMISFLYSAQLKARILLGLIALTFNGCIEMIVIYALGAVFSVGVETLVENNSLWFMGASISKVLFITLAYMIKVRYKNKNLFFNLSYWLMFVIIFIPALTTSYLVFVLTYRLNMVSVNVITLLSFVGLISSAFAAMFLFERVSNQTEILHRQQQYEQQIKSQEKHLNEILVMQKQIKSFRHDMANHYVALNSYFSNEDYEGGIKYINDISKAVESNTVTDTGNIALDAILGTKKALALEKGIEFDMNVQIPQQMFVEATDICVIFGNALDNAIEACEKITDASRWIRLSVIFDNNSVVCKISNSMTPGKNADLKTTKQDKTNHGFGLDNIKQALGRYNHIINTEQEDNEFVLSFIIFSK